MLNLNLNPAAGSGFHRRIRRPGQTLLEIAVAVLIAATTTIAVFSVVISSFVSEKKADKKELSAMMLKRAQQTLQAFVSVDPADPAYSPNAGGTWSADSSGGWALAAGIHDISSLLNTPENLTLRKEASSTAVQTCVLGGPCYLTYTVTDADCGFGTGTRACKTVRFSIKFVD